MAYGVTTTRDPQTATTDVLTYADMVEAGMIPGPRIYSTGPGVGYWGYNIKSLDHARDVLTQYSKYYNTKTIKMYLTTGCPICFGPHRNSCTKGCVKMGALQQ